jgi:hypothetical protein
MNIGVPIIFLFYNSELVELVQAFIPTFLLLLVVQKTVGHKAILVNICPAGLAPHSLA